MNRHTFLIIAALLLTPLAFLHAADLANLRCEYLANPLGIDVARPRLSWVIESNRRGERQTAYQVLVASSKELLDKNKGDLWNSGKVMSDQSVLLAYNGKPLESWQQCHWKVRVWEKEERASDWSQPAAWTMGLLDSNAWQAKWIGTGTTQPASLLLRRDFMVKSRLRRAVVAACGLGHYELTVNGRKVSEDVLTPGWTMYNKTCLYDMYDVTRVLKPGSNALGFMLGNGMYNVKGGRYVKFDGSFGPQKLIAQLCLEFEDGTSETLLTDDQWRVHSGPVTFTCVYGGEDYDARLCQPGWDQPKYPDATWKPAVVTQGPGGALKGLSCAAPPVRCFDTLKPVKTTTIKPGFTLYDLGQNAAQMPRITVSGPAGSSVKILPAEIVRKDNTIDQTSIGGDISCCYTLDCSGRQTWSPRFFYCGYRYLQIECIAATQGGVLPVVESVEGRVVHTSSTPIGVFSTSNELINRIHTMIRWAQRSNMVSVMTDCPHREKLGWLEQTHLNGPALRFNYDLNAFFSKLMNDMADSQLENGLIPDIAPEFIVFGGEFRDSPEWGSAFPQVAWHQYQFAGDIELLRRYYDGMARYVAYLESKAGAGHILSYGLGDWRQLEETPNAVTATTIFFDDVRILAKMAGLLGKTADAARYQKLAAEIREAFNKQFFNPATMQYAAGTQTANAIPLDMGMAPDDQRQAVLGNLVKHLQTNGLKTGEIGFPYLLRTLANGGRSDVIFAMINQTDKPGYGFQLNYGATSLPEDWDYQPKNSQNHFMLGHINEWFYHDLAGIQCDPAAVGFRNIVIKPVPVGDLTWVKAHYDSLYGRIVSNWQRECAQLTMEITIPANTMATVFVPAKDAAEVTESGKPAAKAEGVKFLRTENNAAVYAVGSGTYQFQSTL
ncbi:MAG: glycoside hydrolase family 78 protein [Mariniphaga sp.]